MAVATKNKPAPARTVTRDEAPQRMPKRNAVTPDERLPERDNVIRNRAGEPVSLRYTGSEDEYDLNLMGIIPPDGWTYEWKTKSIKGAEWREHQVKLRRNGWEPVPAKRHDGLAEPVGHVGPIERGGMILMERDNRLTAMARMHEKNEAYSRVKGSRDMAGLMSRHTQSDIIDPGHAEARRMSGVRIDRQPRMTDSKYEYVVDED